MNWPYYTHWEVDSNGMVGDPLPRSANVAKLPTAKVTLAGIVIGASCATGAQGKAAPSANFRGDAVACLSKAAALAVKPKKAKLSSSYWKGVTESAWFKRAHEGRSLGAEISIAD